VQAKRSLWTRSSGGKNGWAPAPLGVKDRIYTVLLLASPLTPEAHASPVQPMHNITNVFALIKRQKGLRAIGHPLEQLTIREDGLRSLPIVPAQPILVGFASPHPTPSYPRQRKDEPDKVEMSICTKILATLD
jgi:hypothetical protein